MSFFTLLGIATGETGFAMMMDRLLEKNDKQAATQAVARNVEPVATPSVVASRERLRPAEPPRERVQYRKSSSGEFLAM
jgi:hypothetical protein